MESTSARLSIEKCIERIHAAYNNEDLFVEASKRENKNHFVADSLESNVLTITEPRINLPRHSIDTRGAYFLLSHSEALKALKQRYHVTVKLGMSNQTFEYHGKKLNCFPALVDHVLKGDRLGSFQFMRDVWPTNALTEAYGDIRQFSQVYNPNTAEERLVMFRRLKPFTPIDEYWTEGLFTRKEVSGILPSFSLPVSIEAQEVTMTYSSKNGAKISDGTTDNIGISNRGIITLENARIIITGVNNTIVYEALIDAETRRLGKIPETDSYIERCCLHHHIEITGKASLQMSVYGTVKDDSPR